MGNVRLGDITDITYAILTRSWNHRTERLGVAVGVNSNALVSLVFFKAAANLPSFTPGVAKLGTTEDLIGHPICSTIALISPVRAKHTPAPPDAFQDKSLLRGQFRRGGDGRSGIPRMKRPSIQTLGRRSQYQGKPAAIRKRCGLGQPVDSARFVLPQGTGSDARNRPIKHLMALPSHDCPRDCEHGMPAVRNPPLVRLSTRAWMRSRGSR
jgi:hypothetical protein